MQVNVFTGSIFLYSDILRVDCASTGVQSHTFSFNKSSTEKYRATYDLAYQVNTGKQSAALCDGVVYNTGNAKNVSQQYFSFSKTIALKTLVNKQGVNDGITKEDDLMIYIYSDVLQNMFLCGEFSVKDSGIIDFNDLKIPCKEYVIISTIEIDTLNNEGNGVRIPC